MRNTSAPAQESQGSIRMNRYVAGRRHTTGRLRSTTQPPKNRRRPGRFAVVMVERRFRVKDVNDRAATLAGKLSPYSSVPPGEVTAARKHASARYSTNLSSSPQRRTGKAHRIALFGESPPFRTPHLSAVSRGRSLAARWACGRSRQ